MRANRPRRRALVLAIAAASALALAVAGPNPAGATGLTLHASLKHTVVRGVQWWAISWTNASGYQHGYVMSVDLTQKGLHIRPGMANGNVNDSATTQATGNRLHAVGGINGDLFSWSTYLPWGGVGVGGSVFKTPARDRPSQFFIRSDGRVGIGPLVFTGSVQQLDTQGKVVAQHVLSAVNTPGSANSDNLTLFTPSVGGLSLRRCAAVSGPVTGRLMTVRRSFSQVRFFDRLASGTKMLAACGTAGQWLLAHAPIGRQLRITQSLTTSSGAKVQAFLSGQRTLRQNGRAYNDTTGFHTTGLNPETAACVSKDRMHVLLIAVDGWIAQFGGGNGITLGELGQLTAALNCYSAVVFDGGGSTTLVAQRSGVDRVVNRMPQLYGQRPVPNGLFIVKS